MKYSVLVEGWDLVEVDVPAGTKNEDIEEIARAEAYISRHNYTATIVPDAKGKKITTKETR